MPLYPLNSINTIALSELQDWTDQYGMMQDNNQNETSWNGNLFTAHYVFALYSNNILSEAEKARITQVYLNNMSEPGLLRRWPNAQNWQAHDDIVGMISADAMMNPDPKDRLLTKMVYEYGKSKPALSLDMTDLCMYNDEIVCSSGDDNDEDSDDAR